MSDRSKAGMNTKLNNGLKQNINSDLLSFSLVNKKLTLPSPG